MSNANIATLLDEAGIAADRFSELFEINDLVGHRRIPVVQKINGRTRTVFHTVGVPIDAWIPDPSSPSIEFFDFGVAAPCSVEVTEAGTVLANFGTETDEVAASFPIFLEGQAREVLADGLGWPVVTSMFTERTAEAIRRELPQRGLVPEATDRRSAWWQTHDFLADITTMWSGTLEVRLRVWFKDQIPTAFDQLLS